MPVHSKNWFIDLDPYSIVLVPLLRIPVLPNPTVESTDIIESVVDTPDKTFVFGLTVNIPFIKSRSLYPTNNAIR